jgi:hypothetical protein
VTDTGEPVASGGVSFERAEFEQAQQAPLSCGFCKKPVFDQYWQISKRPACAQCRAGLERELADSASRRSLFRALQYGGLAAIAGSVGWIVITKVTGYEIGIVAIAIGYLVGKAVRKGAGGLGGPRYQYLAVFLTYSAIALASLPAILEALAQSSAQHGSQPPTHVGAGTMLWAWLVLVAFAYASPFLGGMRSIMGLFIIAIGLYEAWKLTRAVPIEVLGPFSIDAKPPA